MRLRLRLPPFCGGSHAQPLQGRAINHMAGDEDGRRQRFKQNVEPTLADMHTRMIGEDFYQLGDSAREDAALSVQSLTLFVGEFLLAVARRVKRRPSQSLDQVEGYRPTTTMQSYCLNQFDVGHVTPPLSAAAG